MEISLLKLDKMAYSIEEASELTTLSKAFLRLEIKRGELKIKRFGRRVIIIAEDLKEYVLKGSKGGRVGLDS
jgi:excisionase family DNA binding protein